MAYIDGKEVLFSAQVTEPKIEDGEVTEAKIANGAVTTEKLADNAVTTEKLDLHAVTRAKIASDAVATPCIMNGAVTTEKLAEEVKTELAAFSKSLEADQNEISPIAEKIFVRVDGYTTDGGSDTINHAIRVICQDLGEVKDGLQLILDSVNTILEGGASS